MGKFRDSPGSQKIEITEEQAFRIAVAVFQRAYDDLLTGYGGREEGTSNLGRDYEYFPPEVMIWDCENFFEDMGIEDFVKFAHQGVKSSGYKVCKLTRNYLRKRARPALGTQASGNDGL